LSAVLNEWANQSNISIEVQEDKIPVCDEVMGLCEILGFEAASLANEGTFVLAIKKDDANKALEILKKYNQSASIIGTVNNNQQKKVILKSAWGTSRYLESPTGELLPRIC
jgi:hydrogenase expression/formation protein HypE